MAPVWPGSASTTRRPMACRTRATAASRAATAAVPCRLVTICGAEQRVAHGAERLEPGRAGEVVVAGQRGARRRAQRGLETHGVAGLERRRLAHRAHAHPVGPRVRLVLLQRRHADGQALARPGARLDQLDEAVDVDRADLPLAARARAWPPCAAWPRPPRAPPPAARPSPARQGRPAPAPDARPAPPRPGAMAAASHGSDGSRK